MLEDVVDDVDMLQPCRRLADHGGKAWRDVEEGGFEGMVAKDPMSFYCTGRTRSWVKVKARHEGVFYVGGLRNVDAFDGVLVGELVGDQLEYRGVVESGFRARDVLELLREARFAGAELVVRRSQDRARYGVARRAPPCGDELRRNVGGRLRAPSWRTIFWS